MTEFFALKWRLASKTQYILWKMATKRGMYSATHLSDIVPVGRDPDRTKNQSDFKIRYYTLLEIKYMLQISQKFLLSIFYISSYIHNDVTNCQRSLKWRSL